VTAKRELAALGAEVEAWGNAGPLAAVATTGGGGGGSGWAGKENAAADAGAIAAKALSLAALLPRAEAAAAAAPDVGRDGAFGRKGAGGGWVARARCRRRSPFLHVLSSSLPVSLPSFTAGDAVLAGVDAFRAAAGGADAGALRRLRELVSPTA